MLLQLNIRSLLGKQLDLNSLTDRLYQNKSLPKILLLSETHLTKSKMRHLKIQNYTIINNNRTHKTGGRVAIAVHNTLTYSECKDLNKLYNENFECIFIELKQKSQSSIIIGSLYRPPNTKAKEFIEQYHAIC